MILDLSSFFHSTIKINSEKAILKKFSNLNNSTNYPPCNISRLYEKKYRISLALAGFEIKDINIRLEKNILIIKSLRKKKEIYKNYIHKGIALRAFEKKFQLSGNIKIDNVCLKNGH